MSYGNGGEWNQKLQGAGIGQTITMTEPVRPQGVGTELERGEKAAAQLHGALDQLFARLEPLLTPMPPATAGNSGATPEAPVSSIVRVLKAQGYRIDAATQRIGELLQRIEL